FVEELAAWMTEEDSAPPSLSQVGDACWQLFWAGFISPDTLSPVRGYLAGGSTAHKIAKPPPRARAARLNRLSGLTRLAGSPTAPHAPARSGGARWSRLPEPVADPTIRS